MRCGIVHARWLDGIIVQQIAFLGSPAELHATRMHTPSKSVRQVDDGQLCCGDNGRFHDKEAAATLRPAKRQKNADEDETPVLQLPTSGETNSSPTAHAATCDVDSGATSISLSSGGSRGDITAHSERESKRLGVGHYWRVEDPHLPQGVFRYARSLHKSHFVSGQKVLVTNYVNGDVTPQSKVFIDVEWSTFERKSWVPIEYQQIPPDHKHILDEHNIPGLKLGEVHADPKYIYFDKERKK